VLGDLLFEPTEVLYCTLSNPSGGVIADATAIGRIVDNDSPYKNLPTDSIPFINAKISIQQIVVFPKITQEDRRLHLDNLRKEKEAENLRIKKERLEASEQIKKDELAKNHEENKKLQKQLVNIENLRLNKLKSSSNHNSKLCWHCKQKLFPEWNQCVYCRMIA
jgi:hypothetical protein